MTTTLSEGVKVPDVGSTDWADDLETNWNLLNTALAQQGSWAKVDEAQTFTGVQTFSDGIVGSLQGTANMAMSDADGNTITSTYATKTELSTLSDTVGTKANDSSVVHKADAETITGAKTFSDTLTSADVVPSATDTYSLGSASYQYNSIYGKSYFYNGTQWGLDQNQEWTNYNKFRGYRLQIKATNQEIGVIPSSWNWNGVQFIDKNDIRTFSIEEAFSSTETRLAFTLVDNLNSTSSSVEYKELLRFALTASDQTAYFKTNATPISNNAYNLGSSSLKWKTLNGINPGALSLPNLDSYSIITSDFTANLDKTQTTFSWTSSYTGWLYVLWLTQDATAPFWVSVWTVIPNSTNTNVNNSIWGQTFSQPSYVYYFLTYFPVVAGHTYYFERNWVRSTNDSTTRSIVSYAIFLPTLGNV